MDKEEFDKWLNDNDRFRAMDRFIVQSRNRIETLEKEVAQLKKANIAQEDEPISDDEEGLPVGTVRR